MADGIKVTVEAQQEKWGEVYIKGSKAGLERLYIAIGEALDHSQAVAYVEDKAGEGYKIVVDRN